MSSTRFNPPVPTLEELTGVSDITAPDSDGTLVPGENDFSSSSNKPTLRSYISSLTKGVQPTEGIVEYNGPTPPPHANPFPVSVRNDDQPKFTDQDGLRAAVDLGNEPSQIFGDVSQIIDQGEMGSANSSVSGTGHELLPGVVGNRDTTLLQNTVTTTPGANAYARTLGEALASKNLYSNATTVDNVRVSDDRSFVPGNGETGGQASTNLSSRVRLGNDSLGKSYDVPSVNRVSPEGLSEIGRRLMIKAMGDNPDAEPTKWVNGPIAKSRVDVNDVRVASAAQGTDLADLNKTMSSAGQDSIVVDDGVGNTGGGYTGSSWPSAFTPDTPYTGATSGQAAFGAFVTAGTFVGIVLATAAIGSVIPPIAPASVPAEINSGLQSERRMRLGAFRYEPKGVLSQVSDAIGAISDVAGVSIQNPVYVPTNPLVGYGDCVIAGLAYFLGVTIGIDPSIIVRSGPLSANGNSAILLASITARLAVIYADPTSRQYYMNIIRELNRNTATLGGQIGDNIGQIATNAALDVIGIGSATSIFDSKVFKFVNTLARIGDLAYTQAAAIEARGMNITVNPSDAYESFNYGPDGSYPGKVSARGFASRRVYGDKISNRRGSTISLSDLPSMHLIPDKTGQDYLSLLGSSEIANRVKSIQPKLDVAGRKRFSPEQVKAIEAVLDAEYMPFYFQDLRTNEIVSFHAFLETLSDSYNAEYNSSSGYGRIEDVKSYKSTKRAVTVEFNIISMNPQDFEYMWWQINKLTSMVYPQWSKGRQLEDQTGFKFTQPFSQIPTATPVVRLRIGDLIRSNYSRFNLKRLFGRQDEDKIESQTSRTRTTQEEIAAGEEETGRYLVKAGQSYNVGTGRSVKLPTTDLLDTEVEWFLARKVIGYPEVYYTLIGSAPAGFENLRLFIDESSGNVKPEKRKVSLTATKTSSKTTDATFYDSRENSIVYSFESTAGMGLAAVVTQLQFTWLDNSTTWGAGEDGPGNRAPRSCKVQMSFEPIHDIAPGLDHDGFNRAPIYPVGDLINSIVEGSEEEPYGVGSKRVDTLRSEIKEDVGTYKKDNKPGILSKLF